MTEGMRRPPRLWEQKLEGLIRASSLGAGSVSGGTSPIVGAPAPGPGGPGESLEPPPVVDEDPTTPRVPATPSVFPAIGGLSVLWTGLDDNGDPFPTGSRAQVHVSETTGFTPDSNTLRGVVNPGERLVVTDLASGTTYFVRFVLIFPDGTEGEASAQQSLSAGFVLSTNIGQGEITADLVNFDATAIGGIQQFVGTTAPTITNAGQANQTPADGSTWINTSNLSYYTLTSGAWVQRQWGQAAISAGAISTGQLAAGAITADSAIIANGAIGNALIADAAITNAKIQDMSADKLTAGVINASFITVANINASNITAGTLTGRTVQSSTGSKRIVLSAANNELEFFDGSARTVLSPISQSGAPGLAVAGFIDVSTTVFGNGLDVNTALIGTRPTGRAFRVNASGEVFSIGIDDATTSNAANVRVGGSSQLLRSTSTVRVKDQLIPLVGDLEGVDPSKLSDDDASCAWYDVLDICPTEFTSLCEADEGQKILGFIAEDVAAKFPWAAEWDENDEPSSVSDRPILASLLAVVKDQQQTITDLTARIEALEG